jgi:hypothetical protein
VDVARSCLLALFAVGCLAVPSQAATAGASQTVVKQGVKAQVKRGTLRITGSRKGNTVTLRLRRRARGILEVDVGKTGPAEFRFRRSRFRRIVVNGGRGSDTLGISERNGVFTDSELTTVVGGHGNDGVVLTGSGGSDSLAVSTGRRRVRVTRGPGAAVAAASLPITASVEDVAITPLGGADTISFGDLTRAGVDSVALQLGSRRGGDGQADTVALSATDEADALTALGSGPSLHLSGLPCLVTMSNLEGDRDRVALNGSGGVDTLHLAGSSGPDLIGVEPDGALLHTAVGLSELDSDDIEIVRVNALGGTDLATLRDLAGTDVTQVTLDLGSPAGAAADGAVDVVNVNGRDATDSMAVSGGASGIAVSGLSAVTSIVAPDAADALFVNGLGGPDTINASGLGVNTAVLSLRGGPDADRLTGSPGDDEFAWEPGDGSDLVDGGAGSDGLAMAGSDAAETFSLSVATGHTLLARDGDGASIDTDSVESAEVDPRGGPDSILVSNLTGAELTKLAVNLASSSDGEPDTLVLRGTSGPDVVSITGGPAVLGATGLHTALSITGGQAANDRLAVAADAGNDTLDASGVAAGAMLLTLDGDADNDTLTGGVGNDIINGGANDDILTGGPGADVLTGGPGTDVFNFDPSDTVNP